MTYGLVAIVKDEAAVIERCLESAKPYISAATIIDTGSTDGTQAVVRSVLSDARDSRGRFQKRIPLRLLELPFVNFGHSRSEAFAAAQGTADWLIAIDSDFTVEIDPDFQPDPAVDAYLIALGDASFSYRLPLLLNGRRAWKSVGAVHEVTLLADGSLGRREPTDQVRITDHGGGRMSLEKHRWRASLLGKELEQNPNNARTVFYLAQEYRLCGDPRALELYRRRAIMGDWDEEAFYAAFRGALLEPHWPAQQAALLAAWEMRPHRLEPLHALIEQLNQRGQHRAAYRLSGPVGPCGDILFVHRSVWDWGMDFERSIAAWHVGERAESRLLGEELLTRDLPDHIRGAVLRNLAFTESVAA